VEELVGANSMLCMYAEMAEADGVCDFLESGAFDTGGDILQDCQISNLVNSDPACTNWLTTIDEKGDMQDFCSAWSAYPNICAENCDDLARRNIAVAGHTFCIFGNYPDFFAEDEK
jgi:hypothetical protein